MNRISEQIIEELHFDVTSESSSKGILGLCSDASAGLFYAYDQNSIFQVSLIGIYIFAWSQVPLSVHIIITDLSPFKNIFRFL